MANEEFLSMFNFILIILVTGVLLYGLYKLYNDLNNFKTKYDEDITEQDDKLGGLFTNVNSNDKSLKTKNTELTELISAHDTTLQGNTTSIATNAASLETNTSSIGTNTTNLETNATNLETNTSSIGTNTIGLETNTTTIGTNTDAITQLQTQMNTHLATHTPSQ